jgi:hypothetical protein
MRLLLVVSAVAALACAGCGSKTVTKTTHTVVTPPTTTAAPDNDKWVGSWRTTFGQMEIRAEGAKLTGTYDYCGGTLSGTVAGSDFTGTWQEAPDAPNCQRGGNLPNSGTFDFVMNPDGRSFSGAWKYADGSIDKNKPDWNGVLVGSQP